MTDTVNILSRPSNSCRRVWRWRQTHEGRHVQRIQYLLCGKYVSFIAAMSTSILTSFLREKLTATCATIFYVSVGLIKMSICFFNRRLIGMMASRLAPGACLITLSSRCWLFTPSLLFSGLVFSAVRQQYCGIKCMQGSFSRYQCAPTSWR